MNACLAAALWGVLAMGAPTRAVLKPAVLKVGVVFDAGGRGEGGFHAAVSRGLLRATEELGVQTTVVDGLDEAGRSSALRTMAEARPDVVVAVGFLFTQQVLSLARELPDVRFACLDCAPSADDVVPPNALLLSFRDEQAGFLAGSVAGWASKKGRVGFVGGMRSAQLERFETGFRKGAVKARPDAVVTSQYVGDTPEAFTNPVAGRTVAESMFDGGTDVIFHAAGATGLGVFDAARQKRGFVVGVDTNQDPEAPGRVLCSVEKNLDGALLEMLRALQKRTFVGGSRQLGVSDGGLVLTFGKTSPATPALRKKAAALVEDLKAGRGSAVPMP
jgi:basic membrane protein A